METIFEREKVLIGEAGIEKLKKSKVAVIGVGGVGGYVCEMLARSGVGKLLLCDNDVVETTNINRQIIALTNTLNHSKVDVMKERLQLINNDIEIVALNCKFDNNFDKSVLFEYDYIVDAIDDIHNKMLLIKFAKENNLKIVTALGAGNKICVPNYIVADIYSTEFDKLAKIIRKKCKEENIKNLDVVYMRSDAIIEHNADCVGSMSYHACVCGAVLAGYVINQLLKM